MYSRVTVGVLLLEEAEDLLIGQEVDSRLWKESSVLFLVRLVHLDGCTCLTFLLLRDGLVWVELVPVAHVDRREGGLLPLGDVLEDQVELVLGDLAIVVWVQIDQQLLHYNIQSIN